MLEVNGKVNFPIDTDVDITIKKHAKKRSLNANGYYWTLVKQLSDKLSKTGYVSTARIHNNHLRSMWLDIIKYKNDAPIMLLFPDTDETEHKMLEDKDDHYMPIPAYQLPDGFKTTLTKESGEVLRWYTELRGSHTFNTVEMSKLIDMTVQECNDQGIETMTPDELLRLEGYEKQSNTI